MIHVQYFIMKGQPRKNSDDHDDLNISNLIGELSIKVGSSSSDAKHNKSKSSSLRLQRDIDRAGFRIFECISDNGFFSWNPPRGAKYQNLGSVTKSTIFIDCLDLDGKPPCLLRPSSVRTPRYFSSLPPDEHDYKFPFGKTHMVGLHVATCHRGVDLSTIDFAFGGSSLGVLAKNDTDSNPYVATLVPGTSGRKNGGGRCTILLVKNKEYIKNLSDPGKLIIVIIVIIFSLSSSSSSPSAWNL